MGIKQVTKQRIYMKELPPPLGWRPIDPVCVTENGDNTGFLAYENLEEYNLDTDIATGNVKPNEGEDSVDPIENLNQCPLPVIPDPEPDPEPDPDPEPNLDWRPKNPYCVKEDGRNTGGKGFNILEEYDVDTGIRTGVTKPNVIGDPDYVPIIENSIDCPKDVYIWEGYFPYCEQEEVPEPEPEPPIAIDNNTFIFFGFDRTGSTADTEPYLRQVIDSNLRDLLEDSFQSSEQYDNQVKFLEYTSERFLAFVKDRMNQNPNANIINLIFSNEAGTQAYYNQPFQGTFKQLYIDDLNDMNNRENTFPGVINSVLFQMKFIGQRTGEYNEFKDFLQYMEQGKGSFAGANGTKNKDNFVVRYDVEVELSKGADADYFERVILEELRKIGYNI